MTGWDGRGTDPWLPDRLAALADITAGERDIYQDYWGRLSGWLVQVRRAVLAGGRPDANALWAKAPAWAQAMTQFVHGPVKQLMGVAYRRLFGPAFTFDSRPAVAAHLAQVHNRMVRTPDQVFDMIAGQVAEGAGDGESIPKIAKRVEDVLSTTATPTWRDRATVVARTETIGAMNAGRADAFVLFEQTTGDTLEQMWLATDDTRTRRTHRQAEGQRVPLGQPFTVGGHQLAFPGDPTGPASEVIQCRCTTLLVEPGEVVDLSGRQTRTDR